MRGVLEEMLEPVSLHSTAVGTAHTLSHTTRLDAVTQSLIPKGRLLRSSVEEMFSFLTCCTCRFLCPLLRAVKRVATQFVPYRPPS